MAVSVVCHRLSSSVTVRLPHFRTEISVQPASRSQANFICSMSLVRDCLHMHFRKIAPDLWLLWQLIDPLGSLWENACKQRSFFIFCWNMQIIMTKSDKFENGSDRINNGKVMSPWLSRLLWTLYRTCFQPNKLQTFSKWCPLQNPGQARNWIIWGQNVGH